jgi:hypothetical protein
MFGTKKKSLGQVPEASLFLRLDDRLEVVVHAEANDIVALALHQNL